MVDTGGVTSRRRLKDRYEQLEASRRDGAGGRGKQQEWQWQWQWPWLAQWRRWGWQWRWRYPDRFQNGHEGEQNGKEGITKELGDTRGEGVRSVDYTGV